MAGAQKAEILTSDAYLDVVHPNSNGLQPTSDGLPRRFVEVKSLPSKKDVPFSVWVQCETFLPVTRCPDYVALPG